MGFTATANSVAPEIFPIWGVDPILIDKTSYGTAGRPLQITVLFVVSILKASS